MADRHTGKGLDSRRHLTMVQNDECRRRSRSYVMRDGFQRIALVARSGHATSNPM